MSVKAKIEAVIYAADEPVTLAQLAAIFADEVLVASLPFETPEDSEELAVSPTAEDIPSAEVTDAVEQPALPMEDAETKKQARARDREARAAVEKIVEELIAEYANGERGMEIREIAGGYRIATKAEYHDAVRSFVKSLKPQMKLSLQALETLAVVAYKQPITAPEISEIRGVDTSGVLGGLMARKLITTAGRKPVIGRPILYKTTKEFLLRFGLKNVGELPSIEEFEKMAADMAGEMADDVVESADRNDSALETESIGEVAPTNESDSQEESGEVSESHSMKRPRDISAADPDEAEEPKAARPQDKQERLQKILASAGIASRRKAEEFIVQGRVQVNGQLVTELGSKADPLNDHIRVDGKLIRPADEYRYYMLNKPKEYVTTASDPQGRPTVMEFFSRVRLRMFPVGRLDYYSEGLLLVTNDGELANALTRASSHVSKTYLVKVSGVPEEDAINALRRGVSIPLGGPDSNEGRVRTAPAKVRLFREGENPWYEITITEGRNRQLRKMFEEIGHHVEKIRRVEYGPLVLDMPPGEYRELTDREVQALYRAVKMTRASDARVPGATLKTASRSNVSKRSGTSPSRAGGSGSARKVHRPAKMPKA